MSGYLEVKYPFKSNLGLNPFKSWKRQWCILRPSSLCPGGGSLAVYCSEAGSAAGSVELPAGCEVRRAKSRSRPHAFAVFSVDQPRKPRILLAAQTLNDALVWMEKIKNLLDQNSLHGTETLLKDSYSVSIVTTELSRKCGLNGDSLLAVSPTGLVITRSQKLATVIEWKHISGVQLLSESAEINTTCFLTVDRPFQGGGELKFSGPLAADLCEALNKILGHGDPCGTKKFSKSDSDLRLTKCSDPELGGFRRSSWYSGPSEISLDDIDIVMPKEVPQEPLPRRAVARLLAPRDLPDDSMSDRRSLLSISSGVYEEIPDTPASAPAPAPAVAAASTRIRTPPPPAQSLGPEPTYESVSECVYATMRRAPPPLPPRRPTLSKLESWSTDSEGVGSVATLPRCRTLPKPDKSKQGFSVFRKRLKSESRIASPAQQARDKEDHKKKRFEFPPRDMFRALRVTRRLRGLKLHTDAKSCEFLDETEHVTTTRCSKSVECLEDHHELSDELDLDLSLHEDDTLALPQEIMDLILRGREQFKIRLKDSPEGHYLPMSPVVPPPPIEQQYMVMSPRTNLA